MPIPAALAGLTPVTTTLSDATKRCSLDLRELDGDMQILSDLYPEWFEHFYPLAPAHDQRDLFPHLI